MSRSPALTRALAGAALAAALAAPAAAVAEVLVVTQGAVAQYGEVLAGFREVRPAEPVDAADGAALAAALARRPAVVVAVGSKALEAVRGRAGGARVVAAAVLGVEPAGELSVVPLEARAADSLRVLSALAPGARRIAALHPPGGAALAAEVRAAAKAAGLNVGLQQVDELADFPALFRRMVEAHDAVWLLPDARLARAEIVKFMVTTCLERRAPLLGFLDGMTRTGALASVSADLRGIGREAARLAAELEARPADARAERRAAPGHVTVNARVAEMLQLPGRPPEGAELVR